MKNEKKKRHKGLYLICALLVFCIVLSICTFLTNGAIPTDYVAVLDITGTISQNDGATYDQQYLLSSIEEIMADSYNKGLLLRIDSPGGSVYQIDELYLKLMEYKATTGRPVYAAIGNYGTSGGYYEACAADQIYANRNAITGSIGVIIGEFVDLSGLLEKVGVDVSYITSGPNKSMGSSYQPLTEEQKAIYQAICDEYYERFVSVVAEGRNMDEQTVLQLADGRVYSASQAVANGLIDGMEPFEDTLSRLIGDLGYDCIDVQYYSYQAPTSLLDYLSDSNPIKQRMQQSGQTETMQEKQLPQVMMYCQF